MGENVKQLMARALLTIHDEGALHRELKRYLSKHEQGLVMQEFRDARAAQSAQAVGTVNPTGDQLRAAVKSVGSLGTNHGDAPLEYVKAGWAAAVAALGVIAPVPTVKGERTNIGDDGLSDQDREVMRNDLKEAVRAGALTDGAYDTFLHKYKEEKPYWSKAREEIGWDIWKARAAHAVDTASVHAATQAERESIHWLDRINKPAYYADRIAPAVELLHKLTNVPVLNERSPE